MGEPREFSKLVLSHCYPSFYTMKQNIQWTRLLRPIHIQPRFKVSTNQGAGIGEANIWLAGDSLTVSPVYGYYEPPWILIEKKDLAESTVFSFPHILYIHFLTNKPSKKVNNEQTKQIPSCPQKYKLFHKNSE